MLYNGISLKKYCGGIPSKTFLVQCRVTVTVTSCEGETFDCGRMNPPKDMPQQKFKCHVCKHTDRTSSHIQHNHVCFIVLKVFSLRKTDKNDSKVKTSNKLRINFEVKLRTNHEQTSKVTVEFWHGQNHERSTKQTKFSLIYFQDFSLYRLKNSLYRQKNTDLSIIVKKNNLFARKKNKIIDKIEIV